MIELLLLGAIGATLILKLSTLNRGKENSAMDIEEYNKELIRSDFEQSMEMLRHYDTFHWDITKFCVSQILIVIGACWYIYEKQDLEKAREFDPFGHAGFDPTGIIRLTP